MSDLFEVKTCACGCGKRLTMIGAGSRKYWYGHEKIGKDNFWFYYNHPPDCLCGCGQQTDWDPVNLIWKDFKNRHGAKLTEVEAEKLRRKRRRRTKHQLDLFKEVNNKQKKQNSY